MIFLGSHYHFIDSVPWSNFIFSVFSEFHHHFSIFLLFFYSFFNDFCFYFYPRFYEIYISFYLFSFTFYFFTCDDHGLIFNYPLQKVNLYFICASRQFLKIFRVFSSIILALRARFSYNKGQEIH